MSRVTLHQLAMPKAGVSASTEASTRKPRASLWRLAVALPLAGTLALYGCGTAEEPATGSGPSASAGSITPTPPPSEMEPATVRGLAAAVRAHIEGASHRDGNGGSNPQERWILATHTILTGHEEVPLTTIVTRHNGTRAMAAKSCAAPSESLLSCKTTTAPDGSPLVVAASIQDVTGRRSEHGFYVYVSHYRPQEIVLVFEELGSRKPSYIDLTGLPVDLKVLKQIAVDPLVGSRTTHQMNEAGSQLSDFSG